MKNRIQLLTVLMIAFIFISTAGCSTLSVNPVASPHELVDGQAYQLKVLTDKPDLDKIVYSLAWETLAEVLPLKKDGPFTGAVEVIFTSESKVATLTGSVGAGERWYTGGYQNNPSRQGPPKGPSPGARTYQTATLVVFVRDSNGKSLWDGTYHFNGRMTLVESADEAARRSLVKITGALKERLIHYKKGTEPEHQKETK